MRTYHLAGEFADPTLERGLLAAIARHPELYWELLDRLPPLAFSQEGQTWHQLAAAVEAERVPEVPQEWAAAPDPQEAARKLTDLLHRRLWAQSIERQVDALYGDSPRAMDVLLEEEVARFRETGRDLEEGRLQWGTQLAAQVLAQARERRQCREETGHAVTGIPTGLKRLDELLNGLGTGLLVFAGPPGVGKTTFCLQLAIHAAQADVPVVYVTYENSPANLVQKAICARAGVSTGEIERGFADLAALTRAAGELEAALGRLAIVEGTSQLTVAQVRGRALQARTKHKAARCLIVFDYLQRAAHAQGYDQLRHNVSSLSGELRDMANRLDSPVLAISSQNRAAGNYGAGGGSAALDSLKESGDLEYSADAVLFLRPSEKRTATVPARAVDLVLAKNRFGDTGLVPLIFRPDRGDLREEVSDTCASIPRATRTSR